jgi:hypothetical protein
MLLALSVFSTIESYRLIYGSSLQWFNWLSVFVECVAVKENPPSLALSPLSLSATCLLLLSWKQQEMTKRVLEITGERETFIGINTCQAQEKYGYCMMLTDIEVSVKQITLQIKCYVSYIAQLIDAVIDHYDTFIMKQ